MSGPIHSGDSGARRSPGFRCLIVALCVVLFVQALFVTSYIGALHHPRPHRVPLGVVGSSPLPAAVGQAFSLKLRPYPSESAALAAIDHRKIDGAFVAGPGGARLIVVPAVGQCRGVGPDRRLRRRGRRAEAAARGRPGAQAAADRRQRGRVVLRRHGADRRRLPLGDHRPGVRRRLTTRQRRLLALGIVAVFGALITDLVAGPGLGAIPTSKFFTLWGLFILVMMAVAYAAAGLQALLGAAGTLVVVVLFVIFGAPASGGTIPSPYLPTLWRTFGPYLPAGAGTTAVRNTIYFDGNAITKPLLVLAAYLVVGAAVVIVVRRRSRAGNAETEAEASAGVGAVVV